MERWEQMLPPEVASALAPHQRRALNSPTRRRILRLLEEDATPRTVAELAMSMPDASISSVGYHALILDECGCVTMTLVATPDDQGGRPRCYGSNVTAKRTIRQALKATEEFDDIND